MTHLLDRLVKDGYARRYRSEEDVRKSMACITQKGLRKLKEMQEDMKDFSKSFGEQLQKEECRQLSRLCEKIYADRVE